MHFKHEMINKNPRKLRIKWNFELTVFKLTGPDLYPVNYRRQMKLQKGNVFTGMCLFTGGMPGPRSLPVGMGMPGPRSLLEG